MDQNLKKSGICHNDNDCHVHVYHNCTCVNTHVCIHNESV